MIPKRQCVNDSYGVLKNKLPRSADGPVITHYETSHVGELPDQKTAQHVGIGVGMWLPW